MFMVFNNLICNIIRLFGFDALFACAHSELIIDKPSPSVRISSQKSSTNFDLMRYLRSPVKSVERILF
jgi:ribulose bisphosphate carboxylase small subunit